MFRRGGAGKRRDANEPELIKAARAVGAKVWQVGGRGLPDLIVCRRGRFYCGEVKTAKGKETENQGDFPIWRTVDDLLEAIGVNVASRLLNRQKGQQHGKEGKAENSKSGVALGSVEERPGVEGVEGSVFEYESVEAGEAVQQAAATIIPRYGAGKRRSDGRDSRATRRRSR